MTAAAADAAGTGMPVVLPTATEGAAPGEARLTPVELNRLRWRCRRGMLENDLILARFLEREGDGLTTTQVAALDRLLALDDDALWDVLSGRTEGDDPAGARVLEALRKA